MSNSKFIETVIEREEEVNQNLKAIAEEIGLSDRDLVTGASPEEAKAKAQKAALFKSGETQAANVLKEDVIGGDLQEKAETAADLVRENAANTARIADELGVRSSKIAGSPGTTDVEESLKGLGLDGGEERPNYDEMETVEEQKKAFFGV